MYNSSQRHCVSYCIAPKPHCSPVDLCLLKVGDSYSWAGFQEICGVPVCMVCVFAWGLQAHSITVSGLLSKYRHNFYFSFFNVRFPQWKLPKLPIVFWRTGQVRAENLFLWPIIMFSPGTWSLDLIMDERTSHALYVFIYFSSKNKFGCKIPIQPGILHNQAKRETQIWRGSSY